jgi:hypothetical protein
MSRNRHRNSPDLVANVAAGSFSGPAAFFLRIYLNRHAKLAFDISDAAT